MTDKNPASTAVHLIAGTVGGCAGIFVGQPFDTVKTRLQTRSAFYTGPFHCAKLTLKHEGITGFFKGMTSPMVGNAWTNAIMFASYERTLRYLDGSVQEACLRSVAIGGAVSGFLQTIPLTPAELVKCRLQVQDGHATTAYRGPVDCLKHIYKRNGVRGWYLGYVSTLWREVPSFVAYFYVYEAMKRKMLNMKINSHTSMLMAGGVAGVVSWIVSYPLDVLKSQIQTLPLDAKPQEKQMVYQARLLYKMGGWRIFVKGLGTCLMRAFPVNAVTFYVYESSADWMSKYL